MLSGWLRWPNVYGYAAADRPAEAVQPTGSFEAIRDLPSSSGGSASFHTAREAFSPPYASTRPYGDRSEKHREEIWPIFSRSQHGVSAPSGIATPEPNNPIRANLDRAAPPQPRVLPTLSKGLLDRLKAQRQTQTAPAPDPAPASPHPPFLESPPLQPFGSPRANSSGEPVVVVPDDPASKLSPLEDFYRDDYLTPGEPVPRLATHTGTQPQTSAPLSFSDPFAAHGTHATHQTPRSDETRGGYRAYDTSQPLSTLDPPESGSPSIDYEQILAQGWLLLPPLDRPMTDGLLSFNDLWTLCYAILTPHDLSVQLDDRDGSPLLAFEVAEVDRVERLSEHDRIGFEPFCVSLVDGSHFFAAAPDQLGGALWTLKIENARSGAFRRSPDLQPSTASDPSHVPRGDVGSRPPVTFRRDRPVSDIPPRTSSQRPFAPECANELTTPNSPHVTPSQPRRTSSVSCRHSRCLDMGRSSGKGTDPQSPAASRRDDSKRRQRLIQHTFLDIEARFHEQQQQQVCNYQAQQRIAHVVSDVLEFAKKDSREHEAAMARLTSQVDDILAHKRVPLPSPSTPSSSPPPAPLSALLSTVSPRTAMPTRLKKAKQPEASDRPARAPPPVAESRRLLRKRSVPPRSTVAPPSASDLSIGTLQRRAYRNAEPAVPLQLQPSRDNKLAAILGTPGLPEKVARTVYDTVERARRLSELETKAATNKDRRERYLGKGGVDT